MQAVSFLLKPAAPTYYGSWWIFSVSVYICLNKIQTACFYSDSGGSSLENDLIVGVTDILCISISYILWSIAYLVEIISHGWYISSVCMHKIDAKLSEQFSDYTENISIDKI